MKIVLSWLREFAPLTAQPREIAHSLTMLGLAVDAIAHDDGETIFELDITTNRPDCLNHYGVARELAAHYGLTLAAPFGLAPEADRPRARGKRKDGLVEIEATDLCLRYSARIVHGIEVRPSPDWLRKRLDACGVRAINNIADATNYILLAYGHPLHAFDLNRLQGGRILVRNARDGEKLKTLDGVERTLTPSDLVIADAKDAVALAGIMGGEASEISAGTRDVLIEAAWFDSSTIRRSAKRLGMRTEASYRFERGADLEATLPSATKCAELIQSLAGGTIDPISLDAFPKAPVRPPVLLRRWEIERHLGMEVPPAEVAQILDRLGFQPREKGRIGWNCTLPSHRADIAREIDLVEEVARQYGFDKFPLRLPASSGHASHQTVHARQESRVIERVLALGYDETISAVMVRHHSDHHAEDRSVALSNPLSEEMALLRLSLVPGILDAIQWNVNRGQRDVHLFEIGKTYEMRAGHYIETAWLCLGTIGAREADRVGAAGRGADFCDLKGDAEQIAALFSLKHVTVDAADLPAHYRPGHAARLLSDGQVIALFGQLSTAEAEQRKFRHPVYLAEINLDALYKHPLRLPQVKPLSRFPEVERDFSLILPEGTQFDAVRAAVRAAGVSGIEGIRPVETFRGGSLQPGTYSLLLRITLQNTAGTFTEAELAEACAKIIAALQERASAQIRASG